MLRKRYRRITFFFARALAGVIFWELVLPKLGFGGQVRRTRPGRLRKAARAFRSLAVNMGGVLIKVGQFLSTRVDILPDEIIEELADLQDEVPPEPFQTIRLTAERELGMPLEEKFASFNPQPLAAASLGQAHRAVLIEPVDDVVNVVVKVQRTDIEAIVNIDITALRTVARWLQKYPPIRKRADVPALIEELNRSLQEEIDYYTEADYAEEFTANFLNHPGVRTPSVIWTHTTRRVLTLEDVSGIKITDYDAIEAAGIDRSEVAERLFRTYLQQIFEDGFFHADPHPGNLFVQPGADGEGWKLTFIDFGMVGRVPQHMRLGLREMVIGVATQDVKRVVRSYQTMGVLLPSADLRLLERAEARLFERFWGKSMGELRDSITYAELERFGEEFRELLYEMPFQIPQDLVWLGRSVAILSGMCTGMDENFNVWQSIAPFAEKLVKDEQLTGWEFWRNELLETARLTLTLPRRLDRVLGKLESGELEFYNPHQGDQSRRMESASQRIVGALVFGALLLGSIQLHLAGSVLYERILLGGAALVLIWLFSPRR